MGNKPQKELKNIPIIQADYKSIPEHENITAESTMYNTGSVDEWNNTEEIIHEKPASFTCTWIIT